MTRRHIGVAVMILAAPAGWLTVHPPTFGLHHDREWASRSSRRSVLKTMGLAWAIGQREHATFPADDVRGLVQTYGVKQWSRAELRIAARGYDDMREFIKWVRALMVAGTFVAVGQGIYVRRRPRRVLALVVGICVAGFLAALATRPACEWLILPPKGYAYVDDFDYVSGVGRDAPRERPTGGSACS